MPKGFEHAFALLRIDRGELKFPETMEEVKKFCEWALSVVRVYWEREEAEKEALRLNELKAGKGIHYYVQLTRVKQRST